MKLSAELVMKTIEHHDARGPEETVHHLSPVVPA
jgi:hypothetical protein